MRIVSVIGARPQFVKAAPVCRALAHQEGLEAYLVHTGQHFDEEMSAVFFEQLGLPEPDRHLGISGGGHGEMTGRMLEAVETTLLDLEPDWVVVYGDTNSTAAAAMAAAKLPMRVAHVEAGLRSFNRSMPEEINRIVADHLAHLCFAPTEVAVTNLAAEGIIGTRVLLTGDVMYDAVELFTEATKEHTTVLSDLDLDPGGYVLATIHRQENTDDPVRLGAALGGLDAVATDIPVVLPVHPRTARAISRSGFAVESIRLVPPVGYLDMLALEADARVIVTDSGGVQKEAFFHRRHCVTLRDETEWVELIELGWNRLAPPTDACTVAAAVRSALEAPPGREAMPYGDGRASARIVEGLVRG